MKAAELVVGKQYLYDGIDPNGMDWFIPGSVITITRLDGSETLAASGPSSRDNIGASDCKKGEIIDGFVRTRNLKPLEQEQQVVQPTDCHVSINPNSTTIVIQKRLSLDEINAVLKAAGL